MANTPVRLRLSEVLEELNWTQKELAENAGLSENSVSNLLRNPVSIRFDTLEKIRKATGKPVADLIVAE